jgi:transposase
MTRRKFTSKFKTKVVLESLKERESLVALAQKYQLQPTQISAWKREFLNSAEQIFETGKKSQKSEAEQEKERLLKTIGQQKVELDFLKDALR